MPPKRRKAVNADDEQEPKRRVTRSSTKATTKAKATAEPKSKTSSAKATKASKQAKITTPPKSIKTPNGADKPKNVEQPSSEATGPTTLTIEHDSIKNPITCHRYTASRKAGSATPTLIFTHGAGGTLSAPAVVNFCNGYSISDDILAFQGSMNLNARVKGFHACISHLDAQGSNLIILGGRSMGARAAVMAGNEVLASKAEQRGLSLILVSYPLKGPKDIRDAILLDLPSSVRVLFIIGEKDAMCPLDLLDATRKKMGAESKLVVVGGADHGMHVRPAAEEKRLGEEAGRVAAEWVKGEGGREDVYIGDPAGG